MSSVQQLVLGDVYTRCARIHSDRLAVADKDGGLTFKEVNDRACRLAHALRNFGLVHGDRVAIFSTNNLEYIECVGAVAKAGLILVPINFRLQAAEISFLLADSGARLVLIGSELLPTLEEVRGDLPSLEKIVVFGQVDNDYVAYDDLLAQRSFSEKEEAQVAEDDLVALMYTAAVGGRPRGAMMTHRSFVYQSVQVALATGIGGKDTYINLLPMFHTMDLSLAMTFFHLGALNIVLDRFDATAAAELIEKYRVTFVGEFAPMAAQILDAATEHNIDLSSVRRIFGLDSPDTVRAYLKHYPDLIWLGGYGQTETHGLVTVHGIRSVDELDRRPAIPGRPGPLNLVRIVDEDDSDVATDQVGEIVVRGPNVAVGYWQLPEATSQATRNAWHHTGDLGRLDADGYLWFVDRKPEKDLIKTGGENVYPHEVERILEQHPAVLQVCVIAVPDPEWSEAVKAVVVLESGTSATELELIEFCRERIASYKKPKHVVFAQALPKAPDGTVDRQAIKHAYGGDQTAASKR